MIEALKSMKLYAFHLVNEQNAKSLCRRQYDTIWIAACCMLVFYDMGQDKWAKREVKRITLALENSDSYARQINAWVGKNVKKYEKFILGVKSLPHEDRIRALINVMQQGNDGELRGWSEIRSEHNSISM